MSRNLKPFFFAILIAFFLSLYLFGSIQNLKKVNTRMVLTDQGAYIDFTKKAYISGYTYSGDRNRMPVYPFFQSLFYNEQMEDQEFFIRGKYVNIVLSLVILSCLFFIFRKYFDLFHSINLLLITAFSVFIFKAAYFQCE